MAGPENGDLRRLLGPVDGAAVVLSNVVGTGIFLTPALIARRVPSVEGFLGLWILGGALAVVGALAYAELAALRPEAGGEYVYIRESFGGLAGFLSGWTSLVAGFSGAIAAASVGFAIHLGRFLPWAAGTDPLLRLPAGIGDLALTVSPRTLVALCVVAAFTAVHALGLGPGRWVQQALAWLTGLTIVGLVVAGFLAEPASVGATPAADAARAAAAGSDTGGALVALVLVMFTYSGWNAAAYVAGEMGDPGRTLPRALLGGTAVVVVLYLALNLLYVHVLGMGGVAGAEATGDRVAETLWGGGGAAVVTPLILLALASSVSAMILTGPRVYYAMARDRCLPAAFGRVLERGVPVFGIVAQGAWSGILVLSGAFETLLTYTGFAVVLFAGAGVAALFVSRLRKPGAERPFRTWGYPWAPALFVIMSLAMVVQSVLRAPAPSLAGLALICAGIPVYLWTRRRA